MTRRVLVLGLQGSGTSYFCACLDAAGYGTPHTVQKHGHGFPTREALVGRAVNRLYLGGHVWPDDRWSVGFELPGYTYGQAFETRKLAQHFMDLADDEFPGGWYFKNPETLLAYDLVWSMFRWDVVIGVYRHPLENIRTFHVGERLSRRPPVWVKWASKIADVATATFRFPGDGDRLMRFLGSDAKAPAHADGLPRTQVIEPVPGWAREVWDRLEGATRGEPARQEVKT